MTIGSVNSPLSLQESQLLQILQQQSAFRAKAKGSDPDTATPAADTGQNLPGSTDVPGAVGGADNSSLNPDLSPEKISALLLALQTQQASLDTTLLLGGASTSSGGNSLVDYLTGNNNVGTANPLASDPLIDDGTDANAQTANGEQAQAMSLADFLA